MRERIWVFLDQPRFYPVWDVLGWLLMRSDGTYRWRASSGGET